MSVKEEERVPVHEIVNVLEQRTIFKSAKWWQAVVLGEQMGRKFLAVYMWISKNAQWKQEHKLKLNSKDSWLKLKPVIDDMIERL